MVKYFDINEASNSIKCKVICDNFRETKHVVLFVHGFGGHKDNKAAESFAEAAMSKIKNLAVFIIDLPCHGKDVKKKLTLSDCDTYISLTIGYIQNEMKVEDICAYGTSFGGYLLLKYLHDHEKNPFRKIALRCPAVSIGDVMYNRMMTEENRVLLDKGKDIQAGFDRKVLIDKAYLDDLNNHDIRKYEFFDYADDIMIIHGTKDEIVSFDESQKFAEENVIEFIPIDGADHRFQNVDKLKLAHSYMIDFYRN